MKNILILKSENLVKLNIVNNIVDFCMFMENNHRLENFGDLVFSIASCFTDDNLPTKQENSKMMMEDLTTVNTNMEI